MSWQPFDLWEFQEEDITRFEDEEAILLAWEMGTGKSPAAMERDRRIRMRFDLGGKTLLVAPLGTHDKWAEWFREYTPLTVAVIDPKKRTELLRTPAHVYIVHWEVLRLLPSLRDIRWQHIIADECHKAKNHKTIQTKSLKKLRSDFRTGLSGTPATSKPQDFWSVLNWVKPKLFASRNRFLDEYVEKTEEMVQKGGKLISYPKYGGPKNEEQLLKLIQPFYSRHLKKEQCCEHHPEGVMPWLPDKTYDTIYVDLHPQQRKAYDQMADEMLAWIGAHEDEPVAAPVVISQLARLQQFALGYLTYDDNGNLTMAEPSAKLDALMELLDDNPEEQFLVYSQWKAPLFLLGRRLEKAGIPYATYIGNDSKGQRELNKQGFIDGKYRLLLGTIGAGGVGVDGLQTACKTVVFLDRTWSPADNHQAEDRLHRGGQRDVVQVIDIIAKNTVDLGRKQRLEQKWDWIKQLLGDKSTKEAP
ncbi:MAG: DEAD/DEAH box helicase [Desulfurellales bacterium]|nr:MAG: DEAD/DEAH box helicase [Desulfurellales bacterium]